MKYILLAAVLIIIGAGCVNTAPTDSNTSNLQQIDAAIAYGSEPDEWFACSTNADCMYLDSSVCAYQDPNNWRAVNKAFEDEFLAVNATERQDRTCTEMYNPPPSTPPTCVANRCVVND